MNNRTGIAGHIFTRLVTIPDYEHRMDRYIGKLVVKKSALVAFFVSILIIFFYIPVMNYIQIKYPSLNLIKNNYHQHKLRNVNNNHSNEEGESSSRPDNHPTFSSSNSTRHRLVNKFFFFLNFNTSLKQCVLWMIVVGCCSLVGNRGDLVNITKRLGRISCALYPALLSLTLRPSPLPHTMYLSLIPVHKWISRVVILASFVHSILYFGYFVKTNSVFKIYKWLNFAGVLALGSFLIIGFSSIKIIRRNNFPVFYINHYIFTWVSVVLLDIHSRPSIKWYTRLNYLILVSQMLYRLLHTKLCRNVKIIDISSTLAIMEFPKNYLTRKPKYPSSHLRINNIHSSSWLAGSLKNIFYTLVPLQHPFTIASLPTDDFCKLIIRKGNFPLVNDSSYLVTGCFETKIPFFKNIGNRGFGDISALTADLQGKKYHIDARKVMMVVGGSAISFGLPMLRVLNYNGINCKLIWVTRDHQDLCLLNYFKKNFAGLEIYITGENFKNDQDLGIDYVDFEDENAPVTDEEQQQLFSQTATTTDNGSLHVSRSTASLGQKNYGSINIPADYAGDEIDFTTTASLKSSSVRGHSSSALNGGVSAMQTDFFRKPSIVVPPVAESQYGQETRIQVPAGVCVHFGRPVLGLAEYAWCLEGDCDVSMIRAALQQSDICFSENDNVLDPNTMGVGKEVLAKTWVLAAGPQGLVESTKRWSIEHGFQFQDEVYF